MINYSFFQLYIPKKKKKNKNYSFLYLVRKKELKKIYWILKVYI